MLSLRQGRNSVRKIGPIFGYPSVEPYFCQCIFFLMHYSVLSYLFKQDLRAGLVCHAEADGTEEQNRKDSTGKKPKQTQTQQNKGESIR